MDAIDDTVVAEWLAGGKRNGTDPGAPGDVQRRRLGKGRRLVRQNPFARLGISRGPGRRHEQPPSEEEVWKLIRCAREFASPSFAAWLQVAAFTGLRPGELDALRRVNVDLARARIRVVEQFSAMARTFTSPKNGQTRDAPLTEPAREAILSLPVEGEFCFAPIRGTLDRLGPRLPLEGRQGRRGVGGEPLPGHAALRGLVHGQRARAAVRGRGDRARAHRRRRACPQALRPSRPRACARSSHGRV